MKTELEEYRLITCSPYKMAVGEEYNGYYHISGFSHPALPVISSDNKEVIGLREWGLIPFWVKDGKAAKSIQNRTLNAVSETVFEKPSFRSSITKQRCLVLVNGFYEWREYNKKKYPYFIRLKDQPVICLGGVGSSWTDKTTGEIRETFAIITVSANPLMEQIHNTKKRMPLILEGEKQNTWLDMDLKKEDLTALMKPLDKNEMEAWTISNRLNYFQRENTNTADITEPLEYAELPDLI